MGAGVSRPDSLSAGAACADAGLCARQPAPPGGKAGTSGAFPRGVGAVARRSFVFGDRESLSIGVARAHGDSELAPHCAGSFGEAEARPACGGAERCSADFSVHQSGRKRDRAGGLEAKLPLVVLLENGFPPIYKPPKRYFEACAEGRLLMLALWAHHVEKRIITREQCLTLNAFAKQFATNEE